MNRYEALASFLFRVVAMFILVTGVAGVAFSGLAFLQLSSESQNDNPAGALVISVAWIGMGLVLYVAAVPLGRITARGLGSSSVILPSDNS
jgi:hypothetical protein